MKLTHGTSRMLEKWILSRTDRIGDLLLTLPLANFLRVAYPEVVPIFLVSCYTAPLLKLHDPPLEGLIWEDNPSLRGYEAIVHVFPRWSIAWQALMAGIPKRVGTSRRWYHWLTCNYLPKVSRRYSGKHETALNLHLLAPLLPSALQSEVQSVEWKRLLFYRARLKSEVSLPSGIQERLSSYSPCFVLHIGSKGSAPGWTLSAWAELARELSRSFPGVGLFLTGTEGERPLTQALMGLVPELAWVNLCGKLSLAEIVRLFSMVDGVIAMSTGPLHIAAAVDTLAVGIFANAPELGPWRWRPLSSKSIILGGEKVCYECSRQNCLCIQKITPQKVVERIRDFLKH
ncbi:MAG: glycosyltransferase family 9 protein [Bacteroidia bacterium]|nr:glycosyltransferase family 9 protein [Bacteroidia bacterium]MDW8134195.1 glycosyltransferase family 9 protein [Bacteroidia bacterium]